MIITGPNYGKVPPMSMMEDALSVPVTPKIPFNSGLKTVGNLGYYKSPELIISFQSNIELKYKAIIDTGAFDCYFSLAVLYDLKLINGDGFINGQHPKEGAIRTVAFNQSFLLNDLPYIFESRFGIMPVNYQYPVILGSEFLSRCKSLLYLGQENKFEIEF